MLGWQRAGGGEGVLTTIYGVLILPWWAVQFRRLHDTDRSAWWLPLLPFIPIISAGLIILPNFARMVRQRQPLRPRSETFFPDACAAPLFKVARYLFPANSLGIPAGTVLLPPPLSRRQP